MATECTFEHELAASYRLHTEKRSAHSDYFANEFVTTKVPRNYEIITLKVRLKPALSRHANSRPQSWLLRPLIA